MSPCTCAICAIRILSNGMSTKQVLTPEEVAAILGFAPHTISNWCAKGILRGFKPAGTKCWRITQAALDEFMQVPS